MCVKLFQNKVAAVEKNSFTKTLTEGNKKVSDFSGERWKKEIRQRTSLISVTKMSLKKIGNSSNGGWGVASNISDLMISEGRESHQIFLTNDLLLLCIFFVFYIESCLDCWFLTEGFELWFSTI